MASKSNIDWNIPKLTPSNWRILKWLESLSGPRYLLLVYLIALIPRLFLILVAGKGPLSLDEIEYDRIAWYLSEGKGYLWYFGIECTYRPPLYPFWLSIVYSVAGPNYYVARICQAFLSATQGYLTYVVGKEIISKRASRVAGLCIALYLPLVFYSLVLMPENIFISLLLLSIYFLTKARRHNSLRHMMLAGLFLSLSILIRPSFTPFLVLLIPWFYWPDKHFQNFSRHMMCIFFIVLIPAGIWSYRNYCITNQFVFLDTRTGYNLYIGYNENATGSFDMSSAEKMLDAFMSENIKKIAPHLSKSQGRRLFHKEILSYRNRHHLKLQGIDIDKALGDVWLHNYGKEKAYQFIRSHPWKALSLIPKKFMYFWNIEHRIFLYGYSHGLIGHLPAIPLAILFFILLTPFVILVLSAIFSIVLGEVNLGRILLFLPIICLTALHTLTFGDARFHYSIVPFLALFAADSWTRIDKGTEKKNNAISFQGQKWRLIIIFALVTIFVFIWCYGFYESMDKWAAVFRPGGHASNLPF